MCVNKVVVEVADVGRMSVHGRHPEAMEVMGVLVVAVVVVEAVTGTAQIKVAARARTVVGEMEAQVVVAVVAVDSVAKEDVAA